MLSDPKLQMRTWPSKTQQIRMLPEHDIQQCIELGKLGSVPRATKEALRTQSKNR
jgi:hypothetical protein